jgi:hypothetical protein
MSEISPFSSSPYLGCFLSFFDSSFFPFRWGSLKRFLFSKGEWSLMYWNFRCKFCVGGSTLTFRVCNFGKRLRVLRNQTQSSGLCWIAWAFGLFLSEILWRPYCFW